MAKNKLPIAKASVETTETKAAEDREMKYRSEDALRDIERAEAHKRDKVLMKSVKQLAKSKIKCLSKL